MWIWHEVVRSRVSILLFPVIFWKYLETNMNTAIWLIYCILRTSMGFWIIPDQQVILVVSFFLFLLVAYFSMFLYLSFCPMLFICSVSVRIILQTAVCYAGIAIKEHILQFTWRETALVIPQRGKIKPSLSITVHVSTVFTLPMWLCLLPVLSL